MIERFDTSSHQETADVLRQVGIQLAPGDPQVGRLLELAAQQIENACDVIERQHQSLVQLDEMQRGSIADLYRQLDALRRQG